MDDGIIHDVSDTAFMVATCRAMETERPDALFRDPLAGKLAGEHGHKIVESMGRRSSLTSLFVVVRTLIIDALIEAAVADGIDTIINLGAGLDTRPYRMDLPQTLCWVEVDFANIIELKERRLRQEAPRCRLERVKLDLADVPQRRQLLSRIAPDTARALVLTEGVIPYLSTDEVASLADDLKTRPTIRYWIVDYFSPAARRFQRRIGRRMNMQNAPFRFDPDDYFAFFRRHGWMSKDIRYIGDKAKKLNRPLEGPLALRLSIKLMRLLLTRSRRDEMDKSAAYVLLEPSEHQD